MSRAPHISGHFIIVPHVLACVLFFSVCSAEITTVAKEQETETELPVTVQEAIEQEESVEREMAASEDPLAQRQIDKVENPALYEIIGDTFDVYGSAQVRYRESQNGPLWGDGGSRIGINGHYQLSPNYWVLGHAELGFSMFEQLDHVLDPAYEGKKYTDTFFERLGYLGVEAPFGFLTYGKNWSTYYQIADFTDRFEGAGGNASGTFNANSDGGASGTGRADQVWQTRIQIEGPLSIYKPFGLNLQAQPGQSIPYSDNLSYDYSIGFSAILERKDNLKTGIAVNYAAIDSKDLPSLKKIGIDGDDLSILLGAQWFGIKWYGAATFSWLDNHMTTEDGIYFDSWGVELYGHYHLFDNFWLVGGGNFLEPQSGETQAGSYILRYTVLGMRYTFKDFKRMLYANVRFDKSRVSSTGNEEVGNVYTVGFKWDL